MSAKIDTVRAVMEAMQRRDIDAFLEHLTEDIEYHFHVGSRPLLGKDWVRRFLNKYDAGNTEVVWTISTFAENGDKLLVEGLEEYVDESGEAVKHPYMGIFEFRDGRICGWRDYFQM